MSKVKVTEAFNAKPYPLNILKRLLVTVIILGRKIGHG